MAATGFLHGVEVIEIDSGPRPIRTVRSAVIGIVGTAPGANPERFPYHTPVVIAGSRLEAAQLDPDNRGGGTLPMAVDGILDQAGALMVVVRVPEGASQSDTLTNIIGGTDGTGYRGVHALAAAESVTSFQPRILCAPGYTHVKPAGAANPVVSELVGLAERLRAVIIADGPNLDDQAAYRYRADFGSPRVYIVDPWGSVRNPHAQAGENPLVDMPLSAHVAGLIAKTDEEKGFWWSPSNRTLNGIQGTSKRIDFVLGDQESRANLLNENELATVVQSDGFRLWGNRTASGDPKWAFLAVRRTADLIQDSIKRAHLWAVDRPITATYVEDVVEGVNAYMRFLTSLGAILGGECYADPDLNTPDQLAQGKVFFNIRFTPPPPAERVIFQSQLTNDFLTEVFS